MRVYYKMQQILLQNATVLLQIETALLQNATVITKYDVCYELGQRIFRLWNNVYFVCVCVCFFFFFHI